jgi:signal recognition particle receptor subunit beta
VIDFYRKKCENIRGKEMLINHTSKQVTAKIVYYGTGLGGKTTNLQYIYSVTNPHTRGELVCMETEIERTLFFDLLPINVGLVKGYETRFQLYTVPGQVFYDSTRKLVLKGADGIVFVADSQELMEQANRESFDNLQENLGFYDHRIEDIPLVFQFNKRDLKNISPLEKLNGNLNELGRPYFEAVARSGRGVIETLREISSMTLVKIKEALEHSPQAPKNVAVHFDVNHGQQMVKMEDLPVKKVSVDQMADSSAGLGPPAKAEEPAPPEKAPAAVVAEARPSTPAAKSFGELLHSLQDPSRITKIEKIAAGNGRLTVDIKDGDGRTLRQIEIALQPETKKVNIILDVKK